jgi:hypothetical protein
MEDPSANIISRLALHGAWGSGGLEYCSVGNESRPPVGVLNELLDAEATDGDGVVAGGKRDTIWDWLHFLFIQ